MENQAGCCGDNGINIDAVRERIMQRMAEKSLTVADLSQMSAVPRGTLEKFLKGETVCPSFDRVCLVFRCLDMSIDDTIGLFPSTGKKDESALVDLYRLRLITEEEKHRREIDQLNRDHEKVVEQAEKHTSALQSQYDHVYKWCRIYLTFTLICALLLALMGVITYARPFGIFGLKDIARIVIE